MEREHLLTRITSVLMSRPWIKAAWLFGSLGRGDGDDLSDIDLWIVFEDGLDDPAVAVLEIAEEAGSPLFYLEAPQNAPPGGGYLMTCFDAPAAPHLVDWYWQPLSRAWFPTGARMLFDREGLLPSNQPVAFSGDAAEPSLLSRPEHFTCFFWMMLMIAAKYVVREKDEDLIGVVVSAFNDTRRFLGLPEEKYRAANGLSAARKMDYLAWLADQMRALSEILSVKGVQTPHQMAPAAKRYLAMLE